MKARKDKSDTPARWNVEFVNRAQTVWQDPRSVDELASGISIKDDSAIRKAVAMEPPKPPKKRSLDDMRRLDAHLKAMKAYRGK